jgi:hypothetical protein
MQFCDFGGGEELSENGLLFFILFLPNYNIAVFVVITLDRVAELWIVSGIVGKCVIAVCERLLLHKHRIYIYHRFA